MTNFTNNEITLIHELLGMFEITTFDWFSYRTWPGGRVTSVPFGTQIDFQTANDRLDVITAAIGSADTAGTDGRRVRISAILSEYSDISLDSATVSVGGAAGTPGARYSPPKHRTHLRSLLETNLGFRLNKAELAGENIGGQGFRTMGGSIPR